MCRPFVVAVATLALLVSVAEAQLQAPREIPRGGPPPVFIKELTV